MKYKAIKSVAHNFGHSFVSLTNYLVDDYVIGHLARAAVASGEPELRVDILAGDAEPAALRVPPVKSSLEWYTAWFPGLLRDHGVPMGAVRAATMRVRFDLSRLELPLPRVTLPYECVVEITDDRGIVHAGTVRDGWPVETDQAGRPS